ncbi:hypothetical protein BD779DRAFT_818155 [Infundibulicybe gibba]|nr:hypothetical protein BD779DRAFT_818155 [Infundibulicybe gibba]
MLKKRQTHPKRPASHTRFLLAIPSAAYTDPSGRICSASAIAAWPKHTGKHAQATHSAVQYPNLTDQHPRCFSFSSSTHRMSRPVPLRANIIPGIGAVVLASDLVPQSGTLADALSLASQPADLPVQSPPFPLVLLPQELTRSASAVVQATEAHLPSSSSPWPRFVMYPYHPPISATPFAAIGTAIAVAIDEVTNAALREVNAVLPPPWKTPFKQFTSQSAPAKTPAHSVRLPPLSALSMCAHVLCQPHYVHTVDCPDMTPILWPLIEGLVL